MLLKLNIFIILLMQNIGTSINVKIVCQSSATMFTISDYIYTQSYLKCNYETGFSECDWLIFPFKTLTLNFNHYSVKTHNEILNCDYLVFNHHQIWKKKIFICKEFLPIEVCFHISPSSKFKYTIPLKLMTSSM